MEKKLLKLGFAKAWAKDLAWIISSTYYNAYYGYSFNEIYRSNATARQILEITEGKALGMLNLAIRAGRLLCAGENEMVEDTLNELREEAIKKGYLIPA